MNIVKPKALKKGGTIGIVAPSFFIEKEENFKKGISFLESLGYNIVYGKYVFSKYYYTTGTAKEKALDIMSMFMDKTIDAIITTDGGCTSIELIEELNFDLIKNNPKIFSGFSDVSHINLAILAKTGLTTIYGLDIINGFGNNSDAEIYKYNIDSFLKLVSSNQNIGFIPRVNDWKVLREGKAEGYLVGGWLESIANLINTSMFPNYENIILFWETLDLEQNKINMLLQSLKISGLFSKVKGIIIGELINCDEKEYHDCSPSLESIITEITKISNVPILANVDFGHSLLHYSFPEGLLAEIDTNNLTIEIKDNFCI